MYKMALNTQPHRDSSQWPLLVLCFPRESPTGFSVAVLNIAVLQGWAAAKTGARMLP